MTKRFQISVALVAAFFAFGLLYLLPSIAHVSDQPIKLYWFIPDGLRSDPDIFNIFRWAEAGELPNIKKMMDNGAYGYSIPIFPTHTPVNYATLLTGVLPSRHGVVDGPIRTFGYSLNFVSQSGFSSAAKLVDPLWYTLEKVGITSTLLSVPGSTPPELNSGQTIKGRWGGWGFEFPAMVFQSAGGGRHTKDMERGGSQNPADRQLIKYSHAHDPSGWGIRLPQSYSPIREIDLSEWQSNLVGLLVDSVDDGIEYYDTLYITTDKKQFLFFGKVGMWSQWLPCELSYQTQNASSRIRSAIRIKAIKLGKKDFFRIRVLYNGLNPSLVAPSDLSETLGRAIGPMVDFPDNFPPQLIHFAEDRTTFLEEAEMSLSWHQKAVALLVGHGHQNVMIHSIYTPNQMLTSRWWMPFLDPASLRYNDVNDPQRREIWSEVLGMYKHIDAILGEAMSKAGKNSYIVLSSDHGAIPLNYEVRLNNYFARKGWLHFFFDTKNDVYAIDWKRTKVVYLMMNHIYINPKNLSGPYYPSSGPQYQKLENQVAKALRELTDDNGAHPLENIFTRASAPEIGLSKDRVGDLIVVNKAGFNWTEDVSTDGAIFVESLKGGYKQAVDPSVKGLWTPFIAMGPGIKKNFKIENPISHLDQYPTILKMLGVPPPYRTDHGPLKDIFR